MNFFNIYDMKYIKTYEGWRENLAVALSLAGSVFSKNLKASEPVSSIDKVKIEQSVKKYDQEFFKACISFCNHIKDDYKQNIEVRSSLLEASKYFQAKRDGVKTDKLSDTAKKSVEFIMKQVSNLSPSEISKLASEGGGTVSGEIVGL